MTPTPPRQCGTCRHFETSSEWQRGWCRNTLLVSPGQSYLVRSEHIECSQGSLDFWEPSRTDDSQPQENAGQKHVKLPSLQSPLKLFAPAPATPAFGLAGATGGHMMMSSSSGRGGGSGRDSDAYDDYDDEYYDDEGYDPSYDEEPFDDEPEEPARRTRTHTIRGRSDDNAAAAGGRSRTAAYQPEERYWTDYLRIALPVLGLLLILGLLWFWATQLIGGDPDTTDPEPTEIAGVVTESTPEPTLPPVATEDTSTPTTGGDTIPINTGADTTPVAGDTGDEASTPAPDEGEEGGFATQDNVEIAFEANVRPNPSSEGEALRVAAVGETGQLADGPVEAEGFVWWQVVWDNGEPAGWVIEDTLAPAD